MRKTKQSATMLHDLRIQAGLTQRQLAIELGTKTHGQIIEMEKGRRPITKGMAHRLAEVFKCSYKVFL